MKSAEFNYRLLLIFTNKSKIEKVMMMMMQYTDCVVKAHKVQTVC